MRPHLLQSTAAITQDNTSQHRSKGNSPEILASLLLVFLIGSLLDRDETGQVARYVALMRELPNMATATGNRIGGCSLDNNQKLITSCLRMFVCDTFAQQELSTHSSSHRVRSDET